MISAKILVFMQALADYICHEIDDMGKVLGIDYGSKRTGIAISDSSLLIGSPLETVSTHELMDYLKKSISREDIIHVVVGLPRSLDGSDTDATALVEQFITKFKKTFPDVGLSTEDERFSSKIAFQSMIDGNMPKSKRREKGNVDKISAAIILQSYLDKR